MTNHKLIQATFRPRPSAWLLAAGLLALTGISHGQEALRLSMSGDLAAATQAQADSSIGYYNLLLGPTAWRFGSGLGLEFNDNVRLQDNGESDLIIRPSVSTQMHWPLTVKNSLDVVLGAGYSEYLQHQDLSEIYINPGSGLAFNVYAGDFKINLHDRISITEQAYENAGASGANQNLESLQNTAGISTKLDVNQGVANAGYDHANYVSLSQNQGEPDATSENLFANAGLRVRPQLMLGVEAGGSVITYSQTTTASASTTPNAVQWNGGAFGTAQVSDYISVRLDAGYTAYAPENAATNLVTSDTSGYYFSLSLSHRVNRRLSYTLSAGRRTDLAAYGQPQSYFFARVDPVWTVFEKYSVSTPLWWQQGTRIYSTTAGGADYQQIGLGLTVSHNLTQKLSASMSWQFVQETSNQRGFAYTVDIVDLNLMYQF